MRISVWSNINWTSFRRKVYHVVNVSFWRKILVFMKNNSNCLTKGIIAGYQAGIIKVRGWGGGAHVELRKHRHSVCSVHAFFSWLDEVTSKWPSITPCKETYSSCHWKVIVNSEYPVVMGLSVFIHWTPKTTSAPLKDKMKTQYWMCGSLLWLEPGDEYYCSVLSTANHYLKCGCWKVWSPKNLAN